MAFPAGSAAETAIGVTQNNSVVSFDTANPGVFLTSPQLGVEPGDRIGGIDIRPADGQLYALYIRDVNTTQAKGLLYRIDPFSGAVTQLGGGFPQTGFLNGTVDFGVDFNPVVDRLRVVDEADENLRVDPTNGALVNGAPAPGNPNFPFDRNLNNPVAVAGNPNAEERVAAVAYTPVVNGVTTLFGLDRATNSLVRIGGPGGGAPEGSPNEGQVVPIGNLGVAFSANSDGRRFTNFDISPTSGVAYATIRDTVGNDNLYTINLTTGVATRLGSSKLAAPLRGLTIVPGTAQPPTPADSTPPQATITSGPKRTRDRTPTFGFTSNEAGSTFQCKVDTGVFEACTSPATLDAQSAGKHRFRVRAIDRARNIGLADKQNFRIIGGN